MSLPHTDRDSLQDRVHDAARDVYLAAASGDNNRLQRAKRRLKVLWREVAEEYRLVNIEHRKAKECPP